MAQYRFLAYAGLALGLALSSACRAEISPVTDARSPHDPAVARRDGVEAAIGFWRVTTTQGAAYCLIALNRRPVGSDYGVHVESCGVPALAAIRAWRPTDDGFELLRSGDAPGLGFRQTGEDSFESRDGVLKVSRAAVP